MILNGPHRLLNDYLQTILGLRTGQSGRANTHLAQLLAYLSRHLQRAPTESQQRAAPVIHAMLSAKERDDGIGLADTLQYELPAVLDEGEIGPTLLSVDVIRRLQTLDSLLQASDILASLRSAFAAIIQDYPALRGASVCPAAQLYDAGNYAVAGALLEQDEKANRRTPSSAYLLALVKAQQGRFDEAESLMTWAYDQSVLLRDGFAQIGWIKTDTRDWDGAANLLQRDHQQDRLSAQWQLQLAQLQARKADMDAARSLILEAYEKDDALCDGFATLAWLSAEQGHCAGVLELIEEDRQRDRLSSFGMLLSSKHYVWEHRFADAEALVERAYRADPLAKEGYGRIAAAALMIGEEARAMDYWRKDRLLKHESPSTAARFDFMQRPAWRPGDRQAYIHQVHGRPGFDTVEPYLGAVQQRIGDDVIIEVPADHAADVAARFPRWQIANGMVFGEGEPPRDIPEGFHRLSYRQIQHDFEPAAIGDIDGAQG